MKTKQKETVSADLAKLSNAVRTAFPQQQMVNEPVIPIADQLSDFCDNLQFARGLWQRHRAWVEAEEFPAELQPYYDLSEVEHTLDSVAGEEALVKAGIVSTPVESTEPMTAPGAKYFREKQIDRLRDNFDMFFADASLSEIMFLTEALELWDSGQHLFSSKRDCYLADFMYRYLTPGQSPEETVP